MTATCAQLALVLASDQNYLHNTDRQHCRLALGRTPVEKRGMAGELQTCHDAIHLFRYFLPLLVEKCALTKLPLSISTYPQMEEERAAYEELSEQLGCYIGLVSGQRGPGSCSTLPRIQVRVSNAGVGESYLPLVRSVTTPAWTRATRTPARTASAPCPATTARVVSNTSY